MDRDHQAVIVADAGSSLDAMVGLLGRLVMTESPSSDLDRCRACAGVLTAEARELLGTEPEVVDLDGRVHLRWAWGGPTRVLVLGHLDTVWPAGTTTRWPFRVDGDIAHGPGSFDMKAGIVQALHAIGRLRDRDGVTLLVTSDEELGSPTSRSLIEETARGAAAVLVLEASGEGGALKTARKGVSQYDLRIEGRAAHAGLEPEKGVNATIELAHSVLDLAALADAGAGTTVTPTAATAGTAGNTVPAAATLHVDVRAETRAEQERVDAAIRSRRPAVDGTRIVIDGGINRPPLDASASAALFAEAQRVAAALGLGPLRGIAVGGGSDGNFTAGIGVATLDGLGAVGGNAHAEGEHVHIPSMGDRTALLAGLIDALIDARR